MTSGLQSKTVLVVGDVMLDEYVLGEVRRISAEAPVPILEVGDRRTSLGGAANTAANIAALGGRPALVGVVGADEAGASVTGLAGSGAIDPSGLVVDPTRETTVKTRIVARGQQVVRLDHETTTPISGRVLDEIKDAIDDAMGQAAAVVLSDYGKGVLAPPLIERVVAAADGRPVVADPKRDDLSAYRGATVVTPNAAELARATGRSCATVDDAIAAAAPLLGQLGGAAVLVTLGSAGMVLVRGDAAPLHLRARARTVFDITGAGDTVVGALALALANGCSLDDAVELASAAAAVAVSKAGTATLSLAELDAELETPVPE